MGNTRIKANLDRNIVHGEYVRSIAVGENPAAVDITVRLLHQYITPQETLKEIELESVTIPASYLETTNGLFGTSTFEQTCLFRIANPSYVQGLFIEILEVRETLPVLTRVQVIDSTEEARELPSQPFKYPEHEENVPPTLAVEHEDNISTPEPLATKVLYKFADDDVELVQASVRLWFDDQEGTESDIFRPQEYNEKLGVTYIENSITNYLPNPEFAADPADDTKPDAYAVDAPGLVVTSALIPNEDLDGINEWSLRASNVNPFNAFDNVKIEITDPVTLSPGLGALTVSVYYKLASDTEILPFTEMKININFFNVSGDLLSTKTSTTSVGVISNWTPLLGQAQASDIPLTAKTFDFELEIPGIDQTDTFQLDLILPQAEGMPYFTTRALPARIQDEYKTSKTVDLTLPLYITLKTIHIKGPGRRGLASTTTNLKDGFHWMASSDRLRFVLYDSNGNAVFNIGSDMITVDEGQTVEYGIFLDGSNIEFYLDQTLISAHAQTYTIDQSIEVIIGSLEAANTTINGRLEDFKILREKP